MPISILSPANAYNPGSDLWVFPELEESQWTQKVDWYLNFQILKNSQRQSLELPKEILTTLNACELSPLDFNTSPESASLLISSKMQLPNKWVVVAPGAKNFRTWVKHLHQLWTKMKEPSLRVFLPTGITGNSFVESWNLISSSQDLTLVLDSQTKIRSNE
ncbi:MAG: hypothetical protein AABY64_08045 [Bdellovibrionota bacterium]